MSTYVPIQNIVLSSTTASIEFSAIPSTYKDLVIVASARRGINNSGASGLQITINDDTGSNYSSTLLYEGSPYGTRLSNQTVMQYSGVAADGHLGTSFINFQNYANTSMNKTILTRYGTSTESRLSVGLWRSTAAIVKIKFTPANGFAAGSKFTLYGVGTGSPKAFGGTTVTTDGTYWYHAFQASGVFEPLEDISADVLVVAGGGGGAGVGGGGAGGLRSFTSQSFSAINYPVIVGAGGASTTKGNNSSISSISATGGGRGNNVAGTPAATCNGGSGGGGSDSSVGGLGNQGSYSPVEGYNGGTASGVIGGGGGGAGAVGANAASIGGAGGIGATSAIINAMAVATKTGELSGGNYYFASGGGGGYNGSGSTADSPGGGGVGKRDGDATSTGLPNTGGGGGGIYASGGSFITGGSGIVIVRYLA